MGGIGRGRNRTLKILSAIKDDLEILRMFDLVGVPPEPSTARSRAEWACDQIMPMMYARDCLVGLVSGLGVGEFMPKEMLAVKEQVIFEISCRDMGYMLRWLSDRGVSWRELSKEYGSTSGMSMVELLRLDTLQS
jgi:hypothetical protein